MEGMLSSLMKKMGLSSNQLLKCVLLNTAVELFSYIDTSADISSGYVNHEWSTPRDPGNMECAEIFLPPWSSDWISGSPDFLPDASEAEDTVHVISEDELETMYLPMTDNWQGQDGEVKDKFNSEHFKVPEPLYYLICPINLWLEFPMVFDIESTLLLFSDVGAHFIAETLPFCFTTESVQTTEKPRVTREEKTLDNSQMESFSGIFDFGPDVMESILWDSYDLHLSRCFQEFTEKHTTSKREEQPTSSTPSQKKIGRTG